MSYLINIGTAVPKNTVMQNAFAELYSEMSDDEAIKRKIKFICHRSGIEKRQTVKTDLNSLVSISLTEKMDLYFQHAPQLAIKAIENNPAFVDVKNDITDIIMVSCTGMKAPGIEFDVINHFGFSKNIRRYNINFMGCYAAITALRLADEICNQPNRNVLIVSVELCSLHFQQNFSDDYLLSNSLFSDGAASAIVSSESKPGSLKMDDFHSAIIDNSMDEMGWNISEAGFLMSLSNKVPTKIQQNIALPAGWAVEEQPCRWAIHPGGKQILDAVANRFTLSKNDLEESYQTLNSYGNMSSATILFILKSMISNPTSAPIVCCAFGPGLTLESAKMTYV